MHEFKYQLKVLLRDKEMIFWTFLFPLILATFFNLAFSNLTNSEGFDAIRLAVVEEQENESFKALLESLSKEGDDQLFDVQYVTLSEAQQLLEDDEVSGYLTINEDIEITVSDRGFSQTIIQSVVNNYYQVTSTMTNIAELNPSAFVTGVLDDIGLDRDNFNEIRNENVDLTVIYFYTLIGMNCMYGGYWGLVMSNTIEGNLSRKGTRVTMAPTPKIKVLGAGLLAAFIGQYTSMLLLFGYLIFGLGISFGNQVGLIMLLMAVGSYVGITFGLVIGNTLKAKLETKISIGSMLSMAFAFFSGMMLIDMKYWMQDNFPIGAYLNPVNLVTDALYSLYYYTTNERYFFNILCLVVIGTVLLLISLLLMRNKKYDSI